VTLAKLESYNTGTFRINETRTLSRNCPGKLHRRFAVNPLPFLLPGFRVRHMKLRSKYLVPGGTRNSNRAFCQLPRWY